MSPLDSSYIINLSKDGTFRQSGLISSNPADVQAIFQELKEEPAPHLVLYFHGGLVPESGGSATAEKLYPLFHDRVGAHPLFFIWESGGLEVIKNNLSDMAETPFFKELMRLVLKFAFSKLQSLGIPGRAAGDQVDVVTDAEVSEAVLVETAGGSAVDPELQAQLDPLSEDQEDQFRKLLENSLSFQKAADAIANAVGTGEEGRGLGPKAGAGHADLSWFDDQAVADLQAEVATQDEGGRGLVTTTFLVSSAVGILTRVVSRLIQRSDHGLVCTVCEEIMRQFYLTKVGGWLWAEMKGEIVDAFASNAGLSGDILHGGTYFLECLNDYLADPASPALKISMVGHSAGSIYICRLFEAALGALPAGFKFYKVAFLAPGVDFELFNNTLVAHPERFASFLLYTMKDDLESKDAVGGPVYPRSLLYLVSGALEGDAEKPIVGLERFYSGGKPYDTPLFNAVREFIKASDPQRVVWSHTSGASLGFNCTAEHHGGFVENQDTQDSLAAYLST